MDPWHDRCSVTPAAASTVKICPNYPQCAKEERKCLNEIRAAGSSGMPNNYKLSSGIRAAEFSLAYIMMSHYKRKPPR